MLSSSTRLTTRLFKETIEKGRIFHSPFFIVRVVKSQGLSRFSVSAPKKVAKTAVERNKIRRRVYSALRHVYPKVQSGFHGIFIAKSAVVKSSFTELSSDISSLFVKIGLLK